MKQTSRVGVQHDGNQQPARATGKNAYMYRHTTMIQTEPHAVPCESGIGTRRRGNNESVVGQILRLVPRMELQHFLLVGRKYLDRKSPCFA